MPAFQTEKFELTAGPCAAEGYWVTIQSGAFIGSDGQSLPVPSGHTLEGDWGASGTTWSSGDDRHAAPERLNLTWFSYAEDKFYTGDFILPQERIHQLLKQGSWDLEENKQVAYDQLTVCVLPKGAVVVWLTGGNQVLLGRFQGQEKLVTPEEFTRYYGENVNRAAMVQQTRAELPPEVQAEIKAGTISSQRWDAWLKTYPWRVEFAQPLALYLYSVNYVNAERTSNPTTREGLEAYGNILFQPSPKPLPAQLFLYGQTPFKAHYQIRVLQLDQAELRATAERLLKAHADSPLTFFFNIDKAYQKATLSLKNEWEEVPLIKSKVEVLSEE